MKLVATLPVRNEEWVVGLSARVALLWCDAIVIYVHASTDRSWEIACDLVSEYGLRVLAIRDDEPIWDEMQHRQRMLTAARQMGATHIAIVDADEILTGNLIASGPWPWVNGDWPPIAIYEASPGVIVQLPGYNLRGGIDRYHASGIWGNRWFSVAFADDPRLSWSGDKFHAREPGPMKLNAYRPIAQGQGGILHLWGASERRVRAKHAAYKITERLRWPKKNIRSIDDTYSMAINGNPFVAGDQPSRWQFSAVPDSWWAPYEQWLLDGHLDVDAEPWQERYVREAVTKHGADMFKGLDLFGVEK